MRFEGNTVMDQKSMAAMSKAARKTLRRKRNLVIRGLGGVAAAMSAAMGLTRFGAGDANGWIDLALAAVLLAALLMEDRMNSAFAVRQIRPDNAEVCTTFTEEGYTNVTSSAEGHWTYDKILVPCEMKDYFVFMMGKQQGQVYGKEGFAEGSVEEFRRFISEKTGKPVQYIK